MTSCVASYPCTSGTGLLAVLIMSHALPPRPFADAFYVQLDIPLLPTLLLIWLAASLDAGLHWCHLFMEAPHHNPITSLTLCFIFLITIITTRSHYLFVSCHSSPVPCEWGLSLSGVHFLYLQNLKLSLTHSMCSVNIWVINECRFIRPHFKVVSSLSMSHRNAAPPALFSREPGSGAVLSGSIFLK